MTIKEHSEREFTKLANIYIKGDDCESPEHYMGTIQALVLVASTMMSAAESGPDSGIGCRIANEIFQAGMSAMNAKRKEIGLRN